MARKISVEILGDASSLERSFRKANSSAHGFERGIGKAGRGALLGSGALHGLGRAALSAGTAFIGAAGLTEAIRASYDELSNATKVAAQTNAAIRTTGGVANVTAKHVDALAQSLLKKAGIDDEATKSAENILLAFKNVRNEQGKGNKVFDRTTKVVADMATRFNNGAIPSQEQMAKTALRVGKAINDPVKGMSQLARVGVQFTDDQKATIKALVETGHKLIAQRLILRQLEGQFKGSAKAAGQTFPGQLKRLRETFLNLGASLLKDLIPQIRRVTEHLLKWLDNTKNIEKVQKTFRTIIQTVSHVVRIAAAAFNTLAAHVGGAKNALKLLLVVLLAYKALKVTSSVLSVAGAFGKVAINAGKAAKGVRAARVSSAGLSAGLIGKGGLVVAAGVAAFALTTLILKATGLDKKLRGVGASAFDAAANLGLVNDRNKQFQGKKILNQLQTKRVRAQLGKLEHGGLTPTQAADAFAKRHPNIALHDIQVLAGVFSPRVAKQDIVIYLQLDGKTIARHTTNQQQRHDKRNTKPRSGR